MSVDSAQNNSSTPTPKPPPKRPTQRTHNNVDIALPEDQMWSRLMIGRIARQKELRVHTISGKEVVGFVIGLDHEWLQMTTTAGQVLTAVQLLNVVAVEETGVALWNIDVDGYEGLGGPEGKENIERFTQVIYEKARDAQNDIYKDRKKNFDHTS